MFQDEDLSQFADDEIEQDCVESPRSWIDAIEGEQ